MTMAGHANFSDEMMEERSSAYRYGRGSFERDGGPSTTAAHGMVGRI